jgi:hypothetical protein
MSLSKHFDNWAGAAADYYNNSAGQCWDLTPLQMTDCPTLAVILSVMEWSPGVRGSHARQGHPLSSASLSCLHNTLLISLMHGCLLHYLSL